jgi:hypothetical protein
MGRQFIVIAVVCSLLGCGTSHSSMTPEQQAALEKNLKLLAFAYKTSAIEQGEAPSGWDDMSRFLQDTEMQADFEIVREAGYVVHWDLPVADLTGEGAGEVVIAEAGEGSPKVYADESVK